MPNPHNRLVEAAPSRLERYLDVVIGELEGLSSLAQTWASPYESTDDVDSYNSWWESVAGARRDRLEDAYRAGLMSIEQEKRYTEIKALFRERLPLLRRYELDLPRVLLANNPPYSER